ncbi:MAG: hypothetical protein AAF399_09435 [Bacteroidota bacterium]
MGIARLSNTKFSVNLGFLKVDTTWEIDELQKKAAWEMYVELATRITTAPLQEHEGLLREALTSYYSMFETTRKILKTYGPELATPASPKDTTFGHLAVAILNQVLRPLLAKWHPLLTDWEARRPQNQSTTEHELAWEHNVALRTEINEVRERLMEYADVLAAVSGVAKLTE